MDDGFTAARIGRTLGAVSLVIAIGTAGFHYAYDESLPNSLYRALLAGLLSGVELSPENEGARVVSIFMVFAGLTIFAYIVTMLVEGIARGVFTGAIAERRRRRTIEKLRDHYIICGYGRVGRRVAEVFRESGVEYVVLDFNADALEEARERGDHFIDGNGTDDDDLAAAGIAHARGLVASSDSDVDNLYITVSAKSERPDLLVVARASDEDVADLEIRERTGALIIALRKRDGSFDTTPDPEALLEAGDVMIAVGTAEELRLLEELVAPREAVAG